jgi:hypothetical protein
MFGRRHDGQNSVPAGLWGRAFIELHDESIATRRSGAWHFNQYQEERPVFVLAFHDV